MQRKWAHVVNSLQQIVPSYENASRRISLFADARLRTEAVRSAVHGPSLALDLGAGPGTMARLVSERGGEPVLLDVSRVMLSASSMPNAVVGAFEHLPFRPGTFDAVVSGFALRDAYDLSAAIMEAKKVLQRGGRMSVCDLGRPDSAVRALAIGFYLRVAPTVIGLMTAGRQGMKYGSLFDTYILHAKNSELTAEFRRHFRSVRVHETQLGGSIVISCSEPS